MENIKTADSPEQASTKSKLPDPQGEQEGGSKITIVLEYDMKDNSLVMRSKAPTVILFGVLATAQSMITQNQTLQRLQGLKAKMDAESRIIKPS